MRIVPWLTCLLVAFTVACSPSKPGLRLAGSTSVQPLAEVLAEAYTHEHGGRVTIQGGGSTAGVQAVLNGVVSLGAISRRLTPTEASRGLVEHTIGYDVLTVVVHPDNPLGTLTRTQLRRLFSGEVTDWRQVGGRPGPVHLVTREAGSGSREAFRSLVGPISPRAIVQSSSGAIRVAVVDDPHAIGYVSLGVAHMGGLKALRIDGQAAGAPGYALTRPLSLVSLGAPQREAAAFIRFARSPQGQELILQEGLVPLRHEPSNR